MSPMWPSNPPCKEQRFQMRRSPRFLLRSRRAVAFVAIASSVALLTGLAGSAGAVQTPQSVVVSDNPVDFTPNIVDPEHAGYHVEGIAQVGNEIYVGGGFTQVQNAGGGQIYNVTNLFAFNATSRYPGVTYRMRSSLPSVQ